MEIEFLITDKQFKFWLVSIYIMLKNKQVMEITTYLIADEIPLSLDANGVYFYFTFCPFHFDQCLWTLMKA